MTMGATFGIERIGSGAAMSASVLHCRAVAQRVMLCLANDGPNPNLAETTVIPTIAIPAENASIADQEKAWAVCAQSGDVEAFECLVEAYQHPIFHYVFRILHSLDDAEDVTQETFLRAWRSIAQFDCRRPFQTWLFSIASHASFDLLRSRSGSKAHSIVNLDNCENIPGLVAQSTAVTDLSVIELETALGQALSRLSPKAVAVFHLRVREEMSLAAVAQVLNITEADVKVTMHRTRAALRVDLKEWLP